MKRPSFVAIAAMVVCGTSFAGTTISCRVNPDTGQVEATTPWRNALGSTRADQICITSKPAPSSAAAPSNAIAAATHLGNSVQAPTMTQQSASAAPNVQVVQPSPQIVYQPVPVYIQTPPPQVTVVAQPPAVTAPSQSMIQHPAPTAPVPPMVQPQPPVMTGQFDVSPSDVNFRRVLTRWSKSAGWTFNLEHWAVPKDIPVGGADVMTGDFKAAVRRLLDSTLLNDTPVQPCFYSNKVLRVIPATELCARTDH